VALSTPTQCRAPTLHAYCQTLLRTLAEYTKYLRVDKEPVAALKAYSALRAQNLIERDLNFLEAFNKYSLKGDLFSLTMREVVLELVKEGEFNRAREFTLKCRKQNPEIITKQWESNALSFIASKEKEISTLQAILAK